MSLGTADVSDGDASLSVLTTRVRLFASSYAPLFALLALRFESRGLRAALAVIAVASLLDTVRIAVVIPRRVEASPYTVVGVDDRGSEVAGYLATYLLPFLAVTQPSATDLAAYCLYLTVAAVVAIRSNLTHINPTLYLLGYRLLSLTTSEGFSGYAVVRNVPAPGDVLLATHLDRSVLVERRA